MHGHDASTGNPGHPSHGAPRHHHEFRPIDNSYRIAVRATLWVIAGLVFVGFVIWWALT